MSKQKLIKIVSFIGAIAAAGVAALNGDFVTAAGIVAASLSSSNWSDKEEA